MGALRLSMHVCIAEVLLNERDLNKLGFSLNKLETEEEMLYEIKDIVLDYTNAMMTSNNAESSDLIPITAEATIQLLTDAEANGIKITFYWRKHNNMQIDRRYFTDEC